MVPSKNIKTLDIWTSVAVLDSCDYFFGTDMEPEFIEFLRQCIKDNNLHAFYTCWEWICLRADVLEDDKNECQKHKARGLYRRATTVHHIKHVKEYPELALSRFYIDEQGKQQRQLISLCSRCHGEEHPEKKTGSGKKFLTEERW
jgi:5-methylcytosine-specific restriction protein A